MSLLALPSRILSRFTLPPRLVQLVTFGLVGGLAFIVDIGVYNLLRVTVLDDKPIGAKVISVAVATLVAWIGNRQLTFRRERSRPAFREAFLFSIMNVIGLGIAMGCLFISHYVLGFTSQLADNIAGNGVGLVLGMIFRFLAYRYVVFRPAPETPGTQQTPAAHDVTTTHDGSTMHDLITTPLDAPASYPPARATAASSPTESIALPS